ncbi:MAG: hypothetical protein COB37_04685 [Kordiimonadales bacterium]|nr:MAG: hypothetical protein COB37_04685 [Kordiimonadales bacterium]
MLNMVRFTLLPLALFLNVLCSSGALSAQAIVINPNNIEEAQRNQLVSGETFFVNGPFTNGLTAEMAARTVRLGPVGRTLLTVLTVRMAQDGLLSMDEGVEPALPHLLDEHPFQVAVTPRFILTETAGFSIPVAVNKHSEFSHYLTSARTPSQLANTDSVAWALLFEFLEIKGGQPLDKLISKYVLTPMGLPDDSVTIDPDGNSLWRFTEIQGTGNLVAELARLMIRNRAANGNRFLEPSDFSLLTRQYAWRFHPLGETRTLGGVLHHTGDRPWLSPPEEISAKPGASFMAFPDQGVAFVTLTGLTDDFKTAVYDLSAAKFLPPPPDNRSADTRLIKLSKDISFTGTYLRTDAITAWLQDRLSAVGEQTITVRDPSNGRLYVKNGEASPETEYVFKEPFHYVAADGAALTFSTYGLGAYVSSDDIKYGHMGLLGSKFFVLTLIPYVLGMLLTVVFYIPSKVNATWRNMGRVGTVGVLLVTGGVACEYYLWPQVLFDQGMPSLVILWRLLLNIGLMCVISIPMYVILINKTRSIPSGIAIITVPLHLALLSFAAIALLIITMAWGVAGEFGAY